MTQAEEKKALRKQIIAERNKLSDTEIYAKSSAITRRLIGDDVFIGSDTIMMFVSYKTEVRTWELMDLVVSSGKTLAIPRVEGEVIRFYIVDGPEDTEPGCMGIMEPRDRCPEYIPPEDKSRVLMITPGVAFDEEGRRMGYGGGYYDRYFERYPGLRKAALAFELQITDHVPTEETDVKVDMIYTETRKIVCGQ